MVNKVFLLGNLGKDPEIKHFDSNNTIANFSLATNEVYIDKTGQKINQTEWHHIKIGKTGLAKVAEQFLKKGDLVYIEGKLRTRSWEDKEGHKKFQTEIIVENLKLLTKRSNPNEQHTNTDNAVPDIDPFNINDEDLPF